MSRMTYKIRLGNGEREIELEQDEIILIETKQESLILGYFNSVDNIFSTERLWLYNPAYSLKGHSNFEGKTHLMVVPQTCDWHRIKKLTDVHQGIDKIVERLERDEERKEHLGWVRKLSPVWNSWKGIDVGHVSFNYVEIK